MIEPFYSGRSIIDQDISSLTIKIPAQRNWFAIVFICFWLCGWFMGETFALSKIFERDTPLFANAFLLFWVTLWTFGGIMAVYTVIWQLFGIETISVTNNVFSIKKSVLDLGQTKQYDLNLIKNIEINPEPEEIRVGKGRKRTGRIRFDYGMKTIKIAKEIDTAEARMIIEVCKKSSFFRKENFAN